MPRMLRHGRLPTMASRVALAATLLLASVDAAVYKGQVHGENFAFLGKFCFGYNPSGADVGIMRINVTTKQELLAVYVYDDQSWQWPAVYKTGLSCAQMIDDSHYGDAGRKAVDTTEGWNWTVPFSEKIRPRFWYVAAAIDGCATDVDITSYSLEFLNYGADGTTSQFSHGEYGLTGLYLCNLAVFLVLLAVAVVSMRQQEPSSLVMRLLVSAIGCHAFASLCDAVHWASYGHDGIGVPWLSGVGAFFQVLSITSMWTMAALVSMGFGISTFALNDDGNWTTVGLLSALIVCYIGLAIWYESDKDPASTAFVYDSPAGIVIMLLNVIYFAWWARRLRATWLVEYDARKRDTYIRFAVMVGMYFFIVPVGVVVGAVVAPWDREIAAAALLFTLRAIVYVGLAFLMWPSRSAHFFNVKQAHAGLDGDSDFDSYAAL